MSDEGGAEELDGAAHEFVPAAEGEGETDAAVGAVCDQFSGGVGIDGVAVDSVGAFARRQRKAHVMRSDLLDAEAHGAEVKLKPR